MLAPCRRPPSSLNGCLSFHPGQGRVFPNQPVCLKSKVGQKQNTPRATPHSNLQLQGRAWHRTIRNKTCIVDFYRSRRRHRFSPGVGTAVGAGLRNSAGQVLAVSGAAGGVLRTRALGSGRCSGARASSWPGQAGQRPRCRHPAFLVRQGSRPATGPDHGTALLHAPTQAGPMEVYVDEVFRSYSCPSQGTAMSRAGRQT